ncbi:thioredoxin domain-containing protein 5 homolog [Drosophila ficusphila]|uniref:thioredoxin domain-containing protein 5 homolog n=1 Tax=Drosophila ficusphila TaxID=30025 RepID=UPI0007E79812|nr:thioredoxin domain-containing protein 5 homolog [Drosophila ficusphila]
MLARSILSVAVCGLLLSPLLPTAHASQEEDTNSSAGKQADKQFAVELDPETFETAVAGGNVFVKFFAPWCGHCKRLQPLWEQLAEIMNVDEPKVIIAKVDCTKHHSLCATHQVTGYPTLRLFKQGEPESVKFKGTRDLPAITDFINQELSTPAEADLNEAKREEVANPNLGQVVDLTEETFAKHVSSGNHFVKFFAPWCSHCQRLAPTWEELAKELVKEPSVAVSKIDCTQFRSICQDFEVKGYPTLLWIEDGKKIEKYAGSRDLSTLKTYVEKMVGVAPVKTEEKAEDQAEEKAGDEKEAGSEEDAAKKLIPQQITGEAEFDEAIAEGVAFIKFYAPWCGHCQKLQPTWEQLATETHQAQSNVKIAKVDCTAPENKQVCVDQQVEGYPTLFLYKNGKRQNEYEGSRSLPELQAYLKKFLAHDEL